MEQNEIKIGDKVNALFYDNIERVGIVTRIVDHFVEIETEHEGKLNTPKNMCRKVQRKIILVD